MTGQAAARAAKDLLAEASRAAAATSARAGVVVRPLETLDEMTAACRVLEQVWGIGPDEVSEVQPALLRALGHGGNYLFGAYRHDHSDPDRAELVGASVAFFTEPLGTAMHSHITGVLGGTAGSGVGGALKWHQRQWALERGLSRISWTFDPLIARNAYFNLTRLGARPETYFIDFYGPMDDGPNRGQPTDRVQVGWDLTGSGAVAAGRSARLGGPGEPGPDVDLALTAGAATVLSVGPDGEPVAGRPPPSGENVILIGIPADIEAMRRAEPTKALAWRYELRAALALLMADKSWQVTGFARSGWYVLERGTPNTSIGTGS